MEVVRALLEAGANIEDANENGHTPLMEAASAGHVDVAKVGGQGLSNRVGRMVEVEAETCKG